ncbi:MAG TPA: hypothetical protein VLA19_09520 [Herpetosiphonaceae bacterium]|nr:hypothetical protein [Herpetosiphonaceae bacterium]
MAIAADYYIDGSREGTGEHSIIVRIVEDDGSNRCRLDNCSQTRVTQHQLLHTGVCECKPACELWATKHIFQFMEQGQAGNDLDVTKSSRIEDLTRWTVPKEA